MPLPALNLRIIFSAFVGVLLFLSACSNDIEVNAIGDPVPVVWCLLNPDVNEQYVRLGRSFIPDPNNPDYNPVADSTIWTMPVSVYIEEWKDDRPVRVFQLQPVTDPPKDSGFFPNDNLRLYKAEFKPARSTTYHLYVHFPDDYRIVSGITRIPGRPVIYDPLELPGRKINLQSGMQYKFRWAPGESIGVYQSQLIVFYSETLNGQSSDYQACIKMNPLLGLGSEIEMSDVMSGYSFMANMIKLVPFRDGAERTVTNCRFQLFKAGEELALMISPDLQQTSISNNLNQYTNLVNGIGVFSSLQLTNVNNLQLSNTTINELATSELTRTLGFKDIHGTDLNNANDE